MKTLIKTTIILITINLITTGASIAQDSSSNPAEEAAVTFAREVQYLCVADPSAFDPISGKSSLHYAGDVHAAALKKALRKNKP